MGWEFRRLQLFPGHVFDLQAPSSVGRGKEAILFAKVWGFPGGSDGKESACHAGNPGSIPGLGRSPGEGNGYPLRHSCLENPMDRGVWQATVHRVAKSWT